MADSLGSTLPSAQLPVDASPGLSEATLEATIRELPWNEAT